MEIKVLASTKPGYNMPRDEAMLFSGKSAGICYLPDTVEDLFSEPEEKTWKRVNGNLKNGHFSVFGHATYNLVLENIPKILAMILNNEKIYNTSEKSARYTRMENLLPEEKALYEKWIGKLSKEIAVEYPEIPIKKVAKLAQENARYMISIFSPSTTMEYTVSFQQLNFILYWFEEYIEKAPSTKFSEKLKPILRDFCDQLSFLKVEGLDPHVKGRTLSLFSSRKHKTEYGENYSVNYISSLAIFGHEERHRTLHYDIDINEDLEWPQYYIPEIIRGKYPLEYEWIQDIESLQENFPQGMLVKVNERGTIEDFVLKCTERLCGQPQLEILKITEKTLQDYYNALCDQGDEELAEILKPLLEKPRCVFLSKYGFVCSNPCVFTAKGAINRKI